jgi:hypothetical protein
LCCHQESTDTVWQIIFIILWAQVNISKSERTALIRVHLRFFKNVIFQTGFTGYAFNPVHTVILSNLKCQTTLPEQFGKLLEGDEL